MVHTLVWQWRRGAGTPIRLRLGQLRDHPKVPTDHYSKRGG
ncbi:MAG: hypothetical protein AAF830_12095 [Pseudomonadota bacterium]